MITTWLYVKERTKKWKIVLLTTYEEDKILRIKDPRNSQIQDYDGDWGRKE